MPGAVLTDAAKVNVLLFPLIVIVLVDETPVTAGNSTCSLYGPLPLTTSTTMAPPMPQVNAFLKSLNV